MRYRKPDYLLDDFLERREDFFKYFNSMASPREKAMIRDKNSFEVALKNVFSRDESLKYWISNAGKDAIEQFYDYSKIQSLVDENRSRKKIVIPTLKERREARDSVLRTRKDKRVIKKPRKTYVKAYVKKKPIRAIKTEVIVQGKKQVRYRDVKTGRWASVKK